MGRHALPPLVVGSLVQFVFHRFFKRLQWQIHVIEEKLRSLTRQVRENRRIVVRHCLWDLVTRFTNIVDVQALTIK